MLYAGVYLLIKHYGSCMAVAIFISPKDYRGHKYN
jgi:hypothetical protein